MYVCMRVLIALCQVCFISLKIKAIFIQNNEACPINPLTAEWALRTLIDFILPNARRFYSPMGNSLNGKKLNEKCQKISINNVSEDITREIARRLEFWSSYHSCMYSIYNNSQVFAFDFTKTSFFFHCISCPLAEYCFSQISKFSLNFKTLMEIRLNFVFRYINTINLKNANKCSWGLLRFCFSH